MSIDKFIFKDFFSRISRLTKDKIKLILKLEWRFVLNFLLRLLSSSKPKVLVFVFFEREGCNFETNTELVIDYICTKYSKKNTIILLRNRQDSIYSNLSNVFFLKNNYGFLFGRALSKADYIFCGFHQDIIRVLPFLKNNHRAKVINVWHGITLALKS